MARVVFPPSEATSPLADEASGVRLRRPDPREDPRLPIDAAVAMHQLGQYRTALELLAPFTECTGPVGGEALWLAALCHVALGDPAEAVRCLELALLDTSPLEPSRIALLYELGTVLESTGDRARARECFRAVCRRAPWFRDAAARVRALAA